MTLCIQNLSVSYQNQKIFDEVSFTASCNTLTALIGNSGCGKSSLFFAILNKIPYQGHIEKPSGVIAYLPQNDVLLPWRSVMSNLCLPFEMNGTENLIAKERCLNVLQQFNLTHIQHYHPHQLSGGMKKRVALMRAFLTESPLLLLDEPFTGIDELTRHDIYPVLQTLLKLFPKTVLFITHDLEEAALLADQVILLGKPSLNAPTRMIQQTFFSNQNDRNLAPQQWRQIQRAFIQTNS